MAYQPIILPADLQSVMYPEITEEITRGDDTIAQKAINAAIQEAKMYLTRYDITALFGDATATEANPDGIAATFSDDFLTELIKDIARFRLLRLANPSQDYENAGKQYELAKASLKDIQKGIADPRWPYNDPRRNCPAFRSDHHHQQSGT